MMNLAFVGMGSIGKRHFRNVRAYLEQAGTPYSVDLYRSGRGGRLDGEISDNIREEFALGSGVSREYDAVFITNPTSMHYETLRQFAHAAKAAFIEKPVFDTPEAALGALRLSKDGIYYVACPLRYHPVIAYVRQNIRPERICAARAICSSYLPDWRPGTDYRRCYSARRDMGGGADIDLIHEWDYLTWLLGPVETGFSIREQVSALEIDSCDIAAYIARTKRTVIELHLDYFGRKSVRQLQLFLPEDTVMCDLLAGSVCWQASGRSAALDCGRDGYQMAEIRHFFDILEGRCPNDSDIPGALRVLRYARGDFSPAEGNKEGD